MILGYLDKSEKNIDVELQRQQITEYAADNDLTIDMFVQETNVSTIVSSLETVNHTLIIANIVALGASLPQIRENISKLGKLKLTLHSAKEGYVWNPKDIQAIPKGLDLIISIRSSLSSVVTSKALAEKKSQGIRLGRKTPNKKRVFDGKAEEIKQKLAEGLTKTQIAKDLDVSLGYLFTFLKCHPELKGADNV